MRNASLAGVGDGSAPEAAKATAGGDGLSVGVVQRFTRDRDNNRFIITEGGATASSGSEPVSHATGVFSAIRN